MPYAYLKDDGLRSTFSLTALVGISALVVSGVAHAQTPLFEPPIVYQAGQWADIRLADLNEDGVLDIMSMDRWGHAVSTWLGEGDGTFSMRDLVSLPYQPSSGTIVDLDGDGHLDLAITMHHPNNHVQVLLGNGTGDFDTALTPFYANPSLGDIAWGDFDANGTPDIVVAESTTNNSKAHFFSGNGDGTFSDWGAYFIGDRTGTFEVWDFDHDGYLDAAISLTNGNGVRVLWGNGQGQFTVGTLYHPPTTPYLGPIDAADLDLDGDMDLVGVNNNSHSWAVFINNGDRTFTVTSAAIPQSSLPGTVCLGDYTGDGIPDASFGDYAQGGVIVYAGDGTGAIVELTPRYTGSQAGRMEAADLDGDGAIDLAVGGGFGGIAIFLNALGPETVVLSSTKDTTLRKGAKDRNEGGNGRARIQSSGNNRMAVSFDLSGMSADGLMGAWLELAIRPDDPPSQWGSEGRYLECLPVETDWTEGNGQHLDLPQSESTRGTGEGATWNCPSDSDICNQSPDCLVEWDGGELAWGAKTVLDELIVNDQAGIVRFDVTLDVVAALGGSDWDGWVIKKVLEGASGNIRFYTKEGAADAGDPDLAPRLVLEYEGGLLAMGTPWSSPALDQWGHEDLKTTPGPNLIAQVVPNPFVREVTLNLRATSGSPIQAMVLDVNGRRVRDLGIVPGSSDDLRVMWDGRDDRGRAVEAGVYFVRMRSGDTIDRVAIVKR